MLGSCCKSSFIREALMFRHPKYYKELKKNSTLSKRSMTKNNSSHVDQEDQAALGSLPALDPQSDQAISKQQATASSTRSPGSSLKQQAASVKHQAPEDS